MYEDHVSFFARANLERERTRPKHVFEASPTSDAQRTPSRTTNDLLPRAHSDLEAIALGGVRSRARPVAAPSRVGGSARGEPNVPLSRPRVSREFFERGRYRLGRTERHGRPRGSDSRGVVREVRVGGAAGARAESLTGRRGREGPAEPMGASPRRARARCRSDSFPKAKNERLCVSRAKRCSKKTRRVKKKQKKPRVGELARFFFFFFFFFVFSRERGFAARVEGTAATTRTDRAFRAFAPIADPRR